MGQVPAKYFTPSAPYGASPAANAVSPVQPAAVNPQTPLLPPAFQANPIPQATPTGAQSPLAQSKTNPFMAVLGLLLLLLLPLRAEATTIVAGHVADPGTIAVGSASFVRFTLRGCGGNQPVVPGVATLAPTQGGVYFKDFPVNASGNISGVLYSTRDSSGTMNGEIECGSSFTSVWYGMTIWLNGKSGPEIPVHAKNGTTLDVTQVTPITTNPVVISPNGDNTYLRLDAGNSPVIGNLGVDGSITLNGNAPLGIAGEEGIPSNCPNATTGFDILCAINNPNGYQMSINGGPYVPLPSCADGLNALQHVGGPCSAYWGGGDIGAQLNAAYAALPATGGTIQLLPQSGGACYNWSTSVVFGTVGKTVNLVGISPPSNSSGAVETGGCLNWTSSSGIAMTMDWTPPSGGGSTGGGMSNIMLWDNGCVTNGGCGNSAAGLSIGPVNSGTMGATFSKVKFRGWGSGVVFQANGAALSFPLLFTNFTFQQNTIGVNSAQSTEGWHFSTGLFIQNGTAFSQNSPNTQIEFTGVHWDGNTAAGFTGSNCLGVIATFTANHFENNGGTNTHYVSCGGLGDMVFEGGLAIDDNGAGNTDFWFNAANFLGNLKIASVGETATNVFAGSFLSLNVLNGNPSILTGVNNGITSNRLAQPAATTWAGNTSCAGSTKTVTFTTAFINAPIVMLSDRTTAGGARLTAVSPPGFTVACTGATDNFDWLAVGNPN